MTNEHNFNIGDKVTANQYYDIDINGYSTTIPTGEIGLIEDIDDDELYVSFSRYGVFLTLPASDVEPIQPLDRRTAFLTRLQSLLREFDASIEPCGCEIEGLSFVLKDNEEIYYKMDDFSPMRNLTADNIMDFDKEGV